MYYHIYDRSQIYEIYGKKDTYIYIKSAKSSFELNPFIEIWLESKIIVTLSLLIISGSVPEKMSYE